MRLITLAVAALASTAAAQYYNVTSKAFALYLKSNNATINGTALGACHQGAAIEGLCLTGQRRGDPATTYTTFYHNVSASEAPNAVDTLGVLVYVLYGGGGLVVPSAMRLSTTPTSNVGVLIFSPGFDDYSTLNFEQSGGMYIEAYQDDTVSPPTNFEKPLKVKNWYMCLTRWSYLYNTLVWKTGLSGQPQNPSCQKVEVERVWL